MTRMEWLRSISARVQNLRERIAIAGEEYERAEEGELRSLERKLGNGAGGSGRGQERPLNG